jgi:hypothetical protein
MGSSQRALLVRILVSVALLVFAVHFWVTGLKGLAAIVLAVGLIFFLSALLATKWHTRNATVGSKSDDLLQSNSKVQLLRRTGIFALLAAVGFTISGIADSAARGLLFGIALVALFFGVICLIWSVKSATNH